MNFLTNVLILAVLSLIIFTTSGYAQTKFDGSYTFSSRQHVNGPEYGNGVPSSISIKQGKDSLTIIHGEMDQNNQESKSSVAFANNGKPVETKGKTSGRKIIRYLNWSGDKKSFTTTSVIYKVTNDKEIELTRVDVYKLSADGKQLSFNRRSAEMITESWEDNATYAKK
jgi:hypothetical protein